MKKTVLCFLYLLFRTVSFAQVVVSAFGPHHQLKLDVTIDQGIPYYSVYLNRDAFLGRSPLGLVSSTGDFSKDLSFIGHQARKIKGSYTLDHSKVSRVEYVANELTCEFLNAAHDTILIIFRITDNDVAFRYHIPQNGKGAINCTVFKETTGFSVPRGSTTFITPQAPAGTGYKRSKPSYEEEYTREEAVGTRSKYGLGYTFPALFHLNKGWMLLSETGVDENYVGTRLTDASPAGLYHIAFPQAGENNHIGDTTATALLPMRTSWKTITVGESLRPIIASTSATDVVSPLVRSPKIFEGGRAAWSWIVWQDASCNFKDQMTYIDLAAALKCEFLLIDALWDVNIGKEKMVELIDHARSKNVGIMLWYNSNGNWNETSQTPKNKMDTKVARVAEMKWLQQVGVKGIKIDFFGGDKQNTMKLYHDILVDAAYYGLTVNFHGTTLPRGWERMYPSYLTSEAVLASENLIFQQSFADNYPTVATIYPFTRNAVASMDFGPVFLNGRLNRDPRKGNIRRTTDAFEMATAVIFFSAVQHWGLTPGNLKDKPAYLFDYLKIVPATWDETRFIEGYPGRSCVIARRKGKRWYVGAINGEDRAKDIKIDLPMLSGKKVWIIRDGKGSDAILDSGTIEKGKYTLHLSPNGGTVIYTQ